MKKHNISVATTLALLLGACLQPSRAAIIMDVLQVGNAVVATGAGSVDTAGLTQQGEITIGGAAWASLGVLLVGSTQSQRLQSYVGASGPTTLGSIGVIHGTSGSGDTFGIAGGGHMLYLPKNYISGSSLSGTTTWTGYSLSDLGLTEGTHVWTWGSGADADSFTMNISIQPVPEPSQWAMTGVTALGLSGLALRHYRRNLRQR